MPDSKSALAEPLLQEALPYKFRSDAKLFVLLSMLAALCCALLWVKVGCREERPAVTDPTISMVSPRMQGRVWQPLRLARAGPPKQPPASPRHLVVQPVRPAAAEPPVETRHGCPEEDLQTPPVDLSDMKIADLMAYLRSDGRWTRDDEFLMETLGQECSEEDLHKASADLSGLRVGDLAVVLRSDGKWAYAMALSKSGMSRCGTSAGTALTFQVSKDATKKFLFSEFDKVKLLNQPEA